MKKPRKFGDGGETVDLVEPGSNSTDDSAREFAKPGRFSGSKPKVVTKEELAKSGLSLREYMNKQQGLTPRKDKAAAPSKASAAPKAAAPEPKTGPMSDEERAASMERIPRDKGSPAVDPVTGSDLSRDISNTLNATAGLKGVQMGQMAAEAAMGTRAGKALSGLTGGKQAAEVRKIEPTMSNVSAAKRAELAGELRRGAQPTKFTSPKKNPKNTRNFDDNTNIEFRKGGGVKGWGQARGSRAAKIV
jgi:hypothetical protein